LDLKLGSSANVQLQGNNIVQCAVSQFRVKQINKILV
jgi:hypothetical protein